MNISFTSACSGAMTSWTPIDEFTNMYRRFSNGEYTISTFDGNVSDTLYQGPSVEHAIRAWFDKLGVRVQDLYATSEGIYKSAPTNQSSLVKWAIETTKKASECDTYPQPGDVVRVDGTNYIVIESGNTVFAENE